MRSFVDSFTSFIFGKAERCDVYLVFDRYHDFSIKSGTRSARAGQQASRRHKHHLIAASQPGKPTNHRLFPHSIVAGQEASPTEFHRGFQRRRDDLKTTHGDADVTMIQQEAKVVNDGVESIRVLNTDAQLWGR